MLDRLEALHALAATGTMGRAAAMLRITQSAVSKRIAALEAELNTALIEREGRRVRLTLDGERLLAEARPLLTRLREVLQVKTPRRESLLRIAATDSLLASWLPAILRGALDRLPELRVELHAHRGPLLLERVRSGDYALGLCPGAADDSDLVQRVLWREPMVVVPARLLPIPSGPTLRVWTIEKRSLTWEAIATRLPRLSKRFGFSVEVEARLESFAALVQVARAGFAHALVPHGIARELGVPSDKLVPLPGLVRPVVAVGRRSTLERDAVRALLAALSHVLSQRGSERPLLSGRSRQPRVGGTPLD